MKRISLVVAALLPFAAGANEKDLANWDVESLKKDKRVTDIMEAEVLAADGREIGQVQDVVLDNDGSASLLIAAEDRAAASASAADTAEGRNIETPADPRDTDVPENAEVAARHNQADAPNVSQEAASADDFEYRESEHLMRTAGGADGMQSLARLEWNEASFDSDRGAVMLDSDAVEFTGSAATTEGVSADGMERGSGAGDQTPENVRLVEGDVTASSLLGMDVNLENEDSFGRVEDVLISDDGEASAFVIDSWDMADKQRYAIPADISAVNADTGELSLGYSLEELNEVEEFDFDDLESNQ